MSNVWNNIRFSVVFDTAHTGYMAEHSYILNDICFSVALRKKVLVIKSGNHWPFLYDYCETVSISNGNRGCYLQI